MSKSYKPLITEDIKMSTYKYEDLSRSSVDEEARPLPSDLKRAEFEDSPSSGSQRARQLGFPLSLVSNLLFFVFILFLLAQPCYFSSRTCVYQDKREPELPLMADINKIVPECRYSSRHEMHHARQTISLTNPVPTKQITFQANDSYSSPTMFKSSAEFESILATWKRTMPLGRGFILVNHSSTYPALSPPWHLSSVQGDGYSIAYLHQYHCLYMIMKSHGEARFSPGKRARGQHDEAETERHITHCYDYLRQSIFCAGDSAMEGKSRTVGLEMTDGWGDVHVCKDPALLGNWVLDHRFSDKKGID
jgi:hypothetical protein